METRELFISQLKDGREVVLRFYDQKGNLMPMEQTDGLAQKFFGEKLETYIQLVAEKGKYSSDPSKRAYDIEILKRISDYIHPNKSTQKHSEPEQRNNPEPNKAETCVKKEDRSEQKPPSDRSPPPILSSPIEFQELHRPCPENWATFGVSDQDIEEVQMVNFPAETESLLEDYPEDRSTSTKPSLLARTRGKFKRSKNKIKFGEFQTAPLMGRIDGDIKKPVPSRAIPNIGTPEIEITTLEEHSDINQILPEGEEAHSTEFMQEMPQTAAEVFVATFEEPAPPFYASAENVPPPIPSDIDEMPKTRPATELPHPSHMPPLEAPQQQVTQDRNELVLKWLYKKSDLKSKYDFETWKEFYALSQTGELSMEKIDKIEKRMEAEKHSEGLTQLPAYTIAQVPEHMDAPSSAVAVNEDALDVDSF